MTPDHWFTLAFNGLMLLIWALVFFWGQDRKKTQDAIDDKIVDLRAEMHKSFEDVMERFERANGESSKLAGMVQTLIGRVDRMPDELRSKFLPLDRAMDYIEEAKRDRASMWDFIKSISSADRRRSG